LRRLRKFQVCSTEYAWFDELTTGGFFKPRILSLVEGRVLCAFRGEVSVTLRYDQSCLVAIFAPSAIALNFAQTTVG
jgi:hypothetical protein